MKERRRSIESEAFDRENCFLLVADSDPDRLCCTSKILKRFNYLVLEAPTAGHALQITSTSLPSLIIAASALKDMSGCELIRRIRNNPVAPSAHAIILETREQSPDFRPREYGETIIIPVVGTSPPVEPLYQAVQAAVEKNPRKNIRIRTLLPVTLPDTSSPSEKEYATFLSEGGLFLRTARSAPVRKQFSISIDFGRNIVSAEASVVRRNRRAGAPYGEPGLGLQFKRIDSAGLELIRGMIRREITRDIPACLN